MPLALAQRHFAFAGGFILVAATLCVASTMWKRVRRSAAQLRWTLFDEGMAALHAEIAALETRVDEMQTYIDFVHVHWNFIRELWNSYHTLRPILHPNEMRESYTASGTAQQAETDVARVFYVCFNPSTNQMFFRPAILSDQLG